jgi:ABC-type lipoprotein export system ATPase subunit
MRDAVVELRDVFCVHRTGQGDAAALQGAELAAHSGEILCVLGPSGAGKSTLLRVIAGVQTPSAGIVRVLGTDVGRQGERARSKFRHRYLGLLGQSSESTLPPDLSVVESVELPLALRSQGNRETRRTRALELLRAVGLENRADSRPRQLSGGERQRVALCAAVAHRPVLLLADEPTGELDQGSAEQMLDLIVGVARVSTMSVVIASHDPGVSEFADRTVTIAGGRVAQETIDGQQTVVVTESGWLRLPPTLRAGGGIGSRARARAANSGVLVEAARTPVHHPPGSEILGVPQGAKPARVEVQSLTFAYHENGRQRTILDGLSYTFAPGGLTVITGRSGSGKSTLMRLLAGLQRPDAGEVLIDGAHLVARDREQLAALRRQRIGYLPQEPAAVDFLSAQENLRLALALRGADGDDAGADVSALLAALGLADRSRQRLVRLSAGEIQRVALARALATGRGLLLLDEPTSRLDETNAGIVASMLSRAVLGGQTVICATHDQTIIDEADDTVAMS